jgi:hypothetical protein
MKTASSDFMGSNVNNYIYLIAFFFLDLRAVQPGWICSSRWRQQQVCGFGLCSPDKRLGVAIGMGYEDFDGIDQVGDWFLRFLGQLEGIPCIGEKSAPSSEKSSPARSIASYLATNSRMAFTSSAISERP